jgi:hypothetical protein
LDVLVAALARRPRDLTPQERERYEITEFRPTK